MESRSQITADGTTWGQNTGYETCAFEAYSNSPGTGAQLNDRQTVGRARQFLRRLPAKGLIIIGPT